MARFIKTNAVAVLLVVLAVLAGSAQHKAVVNIPRVSFAKEAADAGMVYIYPAGFKELRPVTYGDVQFNYALTLPGESFEVWFRTIPLKKSWTSYRHLQEGAQQVHLNPDSAYIETGKSVAEALSTDDSYFERQIQPETLTDYNADAGKSYLVSLNDSPATKHYNYALIITLQKNHVGNLLAVCLSNDKGPGFFQNINRLKNCLRFK